VAIQVIAEVLGKGIAQYGRKLLFWCVASAAAMMLAACTNLPAGGLTAESAPQLKQAAVTERSKARWQAVIDGEVERSYEFLSSGSRAVTSLATYKARARLSGFRAVDIESAACEAEMCKVKLKVTLDHRLMKGIQAPLEETWMLENGQYWYVWLL